MKNQLTGLLTEANKSAKTNGMIKIIKTRNLRIAQLLLCLFVLYSSSCSSLRIEEKKFSEVTYLTLKVGVCEQDFIQFMKTMKELNITAIDVKPVVDDPSMRFSVLFKFSAKDDFLLCRSEILSTGLVKQLN